MGMCKECKIVFNSVDMASGYCKNCVSPQEFKYFKEQEKIVYKNVQKSEKHGIKNFAKFLGINLLSIFVTILVVLVPSLIFKYNKMTYQSEDAKKIASLKNELLFLEKKITSIKNNIAEKKQILNDVAFDSYFYANQSSYTKKYKEASLNTQDMINNYNNLINQYNIKLKEYNSETQNIAQNILKEFINDEK